MDSVNLKKVLFNYLHTFRRAEERSQSDDPDI